MSKPKRTTPKRERVENPPIWERSGLAAMNAVARIDPTFPSDLIDKAIHAAYRDNGYPVPPWPCFDLKSALEFGERQRRKR